LEYYKIFSESPPEDTVRILLASLLAVIAVLPTRAGDERIKTVLIDNPRGDDPIRIVKVMQGATALENDERQYSNRYAWESAFYAGDDWPDTLSLVIKNVSTKKIVYISAGCYLEETASWQDEHSTRRSTPLPGAIGNSIGRRPEQGLYSGLLSRKLGPDTDRPPFELAPEQEFTLPLEDPEEYLNLKSGIEEKEPISRITACSGGVAQVFFDDGTQWQGHRYLRADPDQPGHWMKMSLEEWLSAKSTK
jgi:hypothetical protein